MLPDPKRGEPATPGAEIHYRDNDVTVYRGRCLDVLRGLPDNSVDSIVTDPPYGLEFMGKDWDSFRGGARIEDPTKSWSDGSASPGNSFSRSRIVYGSGAAAMLSFQAWCAEWAVECLRVLKPGGYMLAFGGSRTWHRLACAVEDAGFEIRESIAWLYGQGFPKSLDVSKAIDKAAGVDLEVVGRRSDGAGNGSVVGLGSDRSMETEFNVTAPVTEAARQWQGWGTALKPAFEPIVVGRKPLGGTVAANVLEHGTGALNIDGCRVPISNEDREKFERGAEAWQEMSVRRGETRADGSTRKSIYGDYSAEVSRPHDAGRWPTNVVLDEAQAAELDKQSGVSASRRSMLTSKPGAIYANGAGLPSHTGEYGYDDAGGASRYFPTFRYEAKAPTSERPFYWRHTCGCDYDKPMKPAGVCETCGQAGERVAHPTVKPVDLMRWLVRLVTPMDGLVLDPFGGSGTTAEAAICERMRAVLVERDADYLPLIEQRLRKDLQPGLGF